MVTAAVPENTTIHRSFAQPGQIDPFDIARLYAKVPAYVERYLADIGDTVSGPRFDEEGNCWNAGSCWRELSAPELQQELEQKRARCCLKPKPTSSKPKPASKWPSRKWLRAASQLKEVEAAADRTDAELDRWRSGV